MSDNGTTLEKRRGRSKASSDNNTKEANKRGRTAADKSPEKDSPKKDDGEAPAKRGRGRPKGAKTAAAAKPEEQLLVENTQVKILKEDTTAIVVSPRRKGRSHSEPDTENNSPIKKPKEESEQAIKSGSAIVESPKRKTRSCREPDMEDYSPIKNPEEESEKVIKSGSAIFETPKNKKRLCMEPDRENYPPMKKPKEECEKVIKSGSEMDNQLSSFEPKKDELKEEEHSDPDHPGPGDCKSQEDNLPTELPEVGKSDTEAYEKHEIITNIKQRNNIYEGSEDKETTSGSSSGQSLDINIPMDPDLVTSNTSKDNLEFVTTSPEMDNQLTSFEPKKDEHKEEEHSGHPGPGDCKSQEDTLPTELPEVGKSDTEAYENPEIITNIKQRNKICEGSEDKETTSGSSIGHSRDINYPMKPNVMTSGSSKDNPQVVSPIPEINNQLTSYEPIKDECKEEEHSGPDHPGSGDCKSQQDTLPTELPEVGKSDTEAYEEPEIITSIKQRNKIFEGSEDKETTSGSSSGHSLDINYKMNPDVWTSGSSKDNPQVVSPIPEIVNQLTSFEPKKDEHKEEEHSDHPGPGGSKSQQDTLPTELPEVRKTDSEAYEKPEIITNIKQRNNICEGSKDKETTSDSSSGQSLDINIPMDPDLVTSNISKDNLEVVTTSPEMDNQLTSFEPKKDELKEEEHSGHPEPGDCKSQEDTLPTELPEVGKSDTEAYEEPEIVTSIKQRNKIFEGSEDKETTSGSSSGHSLDINYKMKPNVMTSGSSKDNPQVVSPIPVICIIDDDSSSTEEKGQHKAKPLSSIGDIKVDKSIIARVLVQRQLKELLKGFVIIYDIRRDSTLNNDQVSILEESFRRSKFGPIHWVKEENKNNTCPIYLAIEWKGTRLAEAEGTKESTLRLRLAQAVLSKIAKFSPGIEAKWSYYRDGKLPDFIKHMNPRKSNIFKVIRRARCKEIKDYISFFADSKSNSEIIFGPDFSNPEKSKVMEYIDKTWSTKLTYRTVSAIDKRIKEPTHVCVYPIVTGIELQRWLERSKGKNERYRLVSSGEHLRAGPCDSNVQEVLESNSVMAVADDSTSSKDTGAMAAAADPKAAPATEKKEEKKEKRNHESDDDMGSARDKTVNSSSIEEKGQHKAKPLSSIGDIKVDKSIIARVLVQPQLKELLEDFVIIYDVRRASTMNDNKVSILEESFRRSKFGPIHWVKEENKNNTHPIFLAIQWKGVRLAEAEGTEERTLRQRLAQAVLSRIAKFSPGIEAKWSYYRDGKAPDFFTDPNPRKSDIYKIIPRGQFNNMTDITSYINFFANSDSYSEIIFGPDFSNLERSKVMEYIDKTWSTKLTYRTVSATDERIKKELTHICIYHILTGNELQGWLERSKGKNERYKLVSSGEHPRAGPCDNSVQEVLESDKDTVAAAVDSVAVQAAEKKEESDQESDDDMEEESDQETDDDMDFGPPPTIPTVMPMAHPHMMAKPCPTVTVFIGNITDKAPDRMIWNILATCGTVVSWKREKAFGFCEYENPDAGLRAIRVLHEMEIWAKKLVAKVDAKTLSVLDEYEAEKWKKRCRSPVQDEPEEPDDYIDKNMKKLDLVAYQKIQAILEDYQHVMEYCSARDNTVNSSSIEERGQHKAKPLSSIGDIKVDKSIIVRVLVQPQLKELLEGFVIIYDVRRDSTMNNDQVSILEESFRRSKFGPIHWIKRKNKNNTCPIFLAIEWKGTRLAEAEGTNESTLRLRLAQAVLSKIAKFSPGIEARLSYYRNGWPEFFEIEHPPKSKNYKIIQGDHFINIRKYISGYLRSNSNTEIVFGPSFTNSLRSKVMRYIDKKYSTLLTYRSVGKMGVNTSTPYFCIYHILTGEELKHWLEQSKGINNRYILLSPGEHPRAGPCDNHVQEVLVSVSGVTRETNMAKPHRERSSDQHDSKRSSRSNKNTRYLDQSRRKTRSNTPDSLKSEKHNAETFDNIRDDDTRAFNRPKGCAKNITEPKYKSGSSSPIHHRIRNSEERYSNESEFRDSNKANCRQEQCDTNISQLNHHARSSDFTRLYAAYNIENQIDSYMTEVDCQTFSHMTEFPSEKSEGRSKFRDHDDEVDMTVNRSSPNKIPFNKVGLPNVSKSMPVPIQFENVVIFYFLHENNTMVKMKEKVLCDSFARSGMTEKLMFNVRAHPTEQGMSECTLMWKNESLAYAIAKSEHAARKKTAIAVLEHLAETCYTVRANSSYYSYEGYKMKLAKGNRPGVYRLVTREDAPTIKAALKLIDDFFNEDTNCDLVFGMYYDFSITELTDIIKYAKEKKGLEYLSEDQSHVMLFKQRTAQYWRDKLLAGDTVASEKFSLEPPRLPTMIYGKNSETQSSSATSNQHKPHSFPQEKIPQQTIQSSSATSNQQKPLFYIQENIPQHTLQSSSATSNQQKPLLYIQENIPQHTLQSSSVTSNQQKPHLYIQENIPQHALQSSSATSNQQKPLLYIQENIPQHTLQSSSVTSNQQKPHLYIQENIPQHALQSSSATSNQQKPLSFIQEKIPQHTLQSSSATSNQQKPLSFIQEDIPQQTLKVDPNQLTPGLAKRQTSGVIIPPQLRDPLWVTTWNVGGAYEPKDRDLINDELRERGDIIALQETNLPTGLAETKHFTWYCSGGPGAKTERGVAILIRKSAPINVLSTNCYTENVMSLSVMWKDIPFTVVCCHLPPANDYCFETVSVDINAKLSEANPTTILLGDFNAHIGSDDQTKKEKHRIGRTLFHRHTNANGKLLKSLACFYNLDFCSTRAFKAKSGSFPLVTCKIGDEQAQLDYILVTNQGALKWKPMLLEAYWASGEKKSDHKMVSICLENNKAFSAQHTLPGHTPNRPGEERGMLESQQNVEPNKLMPGLTRGQTDDIISLPQQTDQLWVTTWDVGGVYECKDREGINDELRERGDIIALQETNMPTGLAETKDFTWYCSGGPGAITERGVAILVRKSAPINVLSTSCYSDSVMSLSVMWKDILLTVVCCHLPPANDHRYETIAADIIAKLSEATTTTILLGNFNAHVGCSDRTERERLRTGSILFHKRSNDNGVFLKTLASSYNLDFCSTRNIKKKGSSFPLVTCKIGKDQAQLDYILVTHLGALKSIQVEAYWASGGKKSDHKLVSICLEKSKAFSAQHTLPGHTPNRPGEERGMLESQQNGLPTERHLNNKGGVAGVKRQSFSKAFSTLF